MADELRPVFVLPRDDVFDSTDAAADGPDYADYMRRVPRFFARLR
jgi:hypothetical protein